MPTVGTGRRIYYSYIVIILQESSTVVALSRHINIIRSINGNFIGFVISICSSIVHDGPLLRTIVVVFHGKVIVVEGRSVVINIGVACNNYIPASVKCNTFPLIVSVDYSVEGARPLLCPGRIYFYGCRIPVNTVSIGAVASEVYILTVVNCHRKRGIISICAVVGCKPLLRPR